MLAARESWLPVSSFSETALIDFAVEERVAIRLREAKARFEGDLVTSRRSTQSGADHSTR